MILVGTDDGIYRWFEGSPWLTFHSLQGRAIVDLDSPGPGVIVAIDGAGRIWETTNNGINWREIPRPEGAGRTTALAVWGELPEIVLATRPLGLYLRPVGGPLPRKENPLTTLLGRARSLAGGSPSGGTATAVADRPTENSPAHWDILGTPSVQPPAGVVPEVRDLERGTGENAPWFAAISGGGLWRSTDAGQTWNDCPGLPAEVYALRAVPRQPGAIVAATSDGCWMSNDNGDTWTDQSAGLEGARHLRAIEVRPDDPKHLLAGAAPTAPGEGAAAPWNGLGFALYESKDGGKSWSHVQRGFPARLEYDTIDDIRWDPAAPGYAIIALASGECWRTRSEGAWWEPIARQISAARAMCAVG